MSGKSNIEWTEATWNPIVGCSIISPGCTNCYAMRDAWRKHHNPKLPHYHGLTKSVNGKPVWTGTVRKAPDHILTAPMHTRKPTMWFVNSMSDLFHESVPDEWIDHVFAVMALCPQHTFQVLTKRADRMIKYLSGNPLADGHASERIGYFAMGLVDRKYVFTGSLIASSLINGPTPPGAAWPRPNLWPLPNVWLGVSCERQQEADERIPLLLRTPATIRFVSAEPLLGPLHIGAYLTDCRFNTHGEMITPGIIPGSNVKLDWVIVGGESGPGVRMMQIEWAETIIAQCREAGVACFVKQLGSGRGFKDQKGGDPSEWPEQFRVRQFPAKPATAEAA